MLWDRLLAAAHLDTTSALLTLCLDASVLVGTATLLCYKDFVQASGSEDARHMHDFFCECCVGGGVGVAMLLGGAKVMLGRAVDRKRRKHTRALVDV